ncbi:hypothetical protein OG923_28485 [Streptomyces halstedii]|uniref:hypothetical protein n=1 Tax=Streptomyces halstedii TaxID=1944 RepID=UPI00325685F2
MTVLPRAPHGPGAGLPPRTQHGPVPVPVPAAVRFRAACPDCRARFELGAGALRLAIGASRRTTFYSFTCPECGSAVRKPAGERIVELLTGGGVRTLRLHTAAR